MSGPQEAQDAGPECPLLPHAFRGVRSLLTGLQEEMGAENSIPQPGPEGATSLTWLVGSGGREEPALQAQST